MNNKEALAECELQIQQREDWHSLFPDSFGKHYTYQYEMDFFNTVKKALEAQIPIIVHILDEVDDKKIAKCPICRTWINSEEHPYCPRCGQAIKWESEGEHE